MWQLENEKRNHPRSAENIPISPEEYNMYISQIPHKLKYSLCGSELDLINIMEINSPHEKFVFKEMSFNEIRVFETPLTNLVNQWFGQSLFHDVLKIAKVISLFKMGDKDECAIYRPVSILPVFLKVLEKAMQSRVNDFFEKHFIFAPVQFGFAIVSFIEETLYFDRDEYSISILLDFSKDLNVWTTQSWFLNWSNTNFMKMQLQLFSRI